MQLFSLLFDYFCRKDAYAWDMKGGKEEEEEEDEEEEEEGRGRRRRRRRRKIFFLKKMVDRFFIPYLNLLPCLC